MYFYNILYVCYIETRKKLEAPERIRNAQSCREYTLENSHYVSSSNYILVCLVICEPKTVF